MSVSGAFPGAVANPRSDTTSFSYDALGNVANQTDPAAGVTSRTYDAAGRLVSRTVPGWGNDDVHLRRGGSADRIKTSYGYDGAGRLTSVNHDTATAALMHFAYTLDADGNRTSLTSAARTESSTLDAANGSPRRLSQRGCG